MKLPRLTTPERHGLIVLSLVVAIVLVVLMILAPEKPEEVEPEILPIPTEAADSTVRKEAKRAKKTEPVVAPRRHHLDERID